MEEGWIGWSAGIIDGEGSIGIVLRRRNRGGCNWVDYCVRVTISNTDLNMMLKLVELWGGNFHKVSRPTRNHKDCYHYCCTGLMVLKMLELIEPYLITKKVRAQLAISFQKRVSGRMGREEGCVVKMSEEEKELRHKMYLQMKTIKNYGGSNVEVGR